jgi:hypothetical protein
MAIAARVRIVVYIATSERPTVAKRQQAMARL